MTQNAVVDDARTGVRVVQSAPSSRRSGCQVSRGAEREGRRADGEQRSGREKGGAGERRGAA
eukprot:1167693-Rhodomonas_salina.1